MKTLLKLFSIGVLALGMASCSNDEGSTLGVANTRAVTIITDNVTTNTTWSGEIELAKKIAVVGQGVTLTIQPGTIIRGQATGTPQDATALIITKGAKINAIGTSTNPIVMTAKNGTVGGWGGLVILGKAPINQSGTKYIEGIIEGSLPGVDTSYGGTDPNDDSGVLQYVRVEYAGATIGSNNELNSFTFGGVGSGTTIDHCQAYYGDDDGFEFFGGTVNADHLVAIGTTDDSFDFDFGYTGTIQFAVSTVASSRLTSDPNGIECDNDASGSLSTPYTHPVLSNLTIIGSQNGTSLKSAADFRRNCEFTLVNSVLYGFPRGILKETANSTYTLENNVVVAAPAGSGINFSTSPSTTGTFTPSSTNSGLTSYGDIVLNNPWGGYKTIGLRPTANPALTGFTSVPGIQAVTYKGAVAPTGQNWLTGTWIR